MSVSLIDGHIDREKQTMTDNEKNSTTEITTDDEKILVDKTWDCAVRYDPRDTIAQQQKTIDRQQAEIELYRKDQDKLKMERDELKAEIERLKVCPKCVYEYDGEMTEYCSQSPCPNFKTVDEIKSEAVTEFAENVTYCKDCKNYELMTSNNQRFCNKYGGYVKETDCCSRGTPCKGNGG